VRGIAIAVVLLAALVVAFGCTRSEQAQPETKEVKTDKGAGGTQATAPAAKEIALTADNDGETVELSVGQEFTIALESNPSTGYGWEVLPMPEPVVKQVGEAEFKQDETSGRRVGVGGTATFRFKAVEAGNGPLKLVYRRSWETEVEPIKSFSVKIVVKE
jgi:inhibitor of cysteine peptidase